MRVKFTRMLAALRCIKSAGAGDGAPSIRASEFTISVSPGSNGGILATTFFEQSGAFLHFISHFGFGHKFGFLHSHLQTGAAQTWRHG
jgi:hypothetical protein